MTCERKHNNAYMEKESIYRLISFVERPLLKTNWKGLQRGGGGGSKQGVRVRAGVVALNIREVLRAHAMVIPRSPQSRGQLSPSYVESIPPHFCNAFFMFFFVDMIPLLYPSPPYRTC